MTFLPAFGTLVQTTLTFNNEGGIVPADFPVYLYSIPQNAVNDITPACAAKIAAHRHAPLPLAPPTLNRTNETIAVRGRFQ